MTEWERMRDGGLYRADDPALVRARHRAGILTHRFNHADPAAPDYALTQRALLEELLGRVGDHCWIEPPFRCDYGSQIFLGDHFYANYDCIFLDVAPITIGAHAFLGPRVCLYTAGHPLAAPVRNLELEFGRPITIGESVWIGGSTVVLPGVSIGDGTVVAAGSVVTKDLPGGVVAAGNPCRVLRPITDADRAVWERRRLDYQRSLEEE